MKLSLLNAAAIALATILAASFSSAEAMTCEGRNSETGARVTGSCVNNVFEGQDVTNNYAVYGYCFGNGKLEAYDLNTEAFVGGTCGNSVTFSQPASSVTPAPPAIPAQPILPKTLPEKSKDLEQLAPTASAAPISNEPTLEEQLDQIYQEIDDSEAIPDTADPVKRPSATR